MRVIFLVFVIFSSLMALDAKIKYEKVLQNIQKHYFRAYTKDELVLKSIQNLLETTLYITKSEKNDINKRVKLTKNADKKIEIVVRFLQEKGFLETQIYEKFISSCMDSLDAYSRYLDKKQMQDLELKTQGVFVGLGINLVKINNSLIVLSVLKDSPASTAGIKISDKVLKIDGVTCDRISLDRAIELLRKDAGESVWLSIERDNILMDLEIKAQIIRVETLEFRKLKNRTLYFKLSSFDAHIAQKISDKIKEHQGSSKAIVIDLRGNPGGFVSQAIEIADIFLNRGNIITQVGRNESQKRSYDASRQKTLTNLPLAVLVDSNTASSAEILSGALQIHHRATLFGEKTFGKGSVESLYSISKDESISLTVAHYFLADSSTIEGVGIMPDYEVNTVIVDGRDECLETAKEFLYNKESFTKKYPLQSNGVCTKEEK